MPNGSIKIVVKMSGIGVKIFMGEVATYKGALLEGRYKAQIGGSGAVCEIGKRGLLSQEGERKRGI